jgi:hypothetical protein
VRVNVIVFGLAVMHRFPGESMAQHKSNPLTGTEVGEPIPGKKTRDSHDESIPIGGNGLEQSLWTRWHVAMQQDLTVLVKNTDVHGTGMPINTTIKLVLFRGEAPEVSSSLERDVSHSRHTTGVC